MCCSRYSAYGRSANDSSPIQSCAAPVWTDRPFATEGSTGLRPATGLLLQPVDVLGRLGLRQVGRQLLAGLPGQRVEIAALRAGHRLVAGDPLARVLLGGAGSAGGVGADGVRLASGLDRGVRIDGSLDHGARLGRLLAVRIARLSHGLSLGAIAAAQRSPDLRSDIGSTSHS